MIDNASIVQLKWQTKSNAQEGPAGTLTAFVVFVITSGPVAQWVWRCVRPCGYRCMHMAHSLGVRLPPGPFLITPRCSIFSCSCHLPRIPVRLDGIRHGVAVQGREEPYWLLPQRRLGGCQEASNCQLFDICIEVGCAFLVFSMRLSEFNATMASPTIWRHLTYEQVADVAWLS